MNTRDKLQIIAAANDRNRRRDAEFAQKQKNPANGKEKKKCRLKAR